MTSHFFNHPLVNLHYYRFGNGPKTMLCFHGYGMHGKQFSVLKEKLGNEYTFYGFDLFFHKETTLHDQSIQQVKNGISKTDFCELITSFCAMQGIDRFCVIGYSLGSHYASVLAEKEAQRIDQLFILAPAFLKVFPPFQVMSKNKIANYAFRKLFLSENGIKVVLNFCKTLRIIDEKSHGILKSEMATKDLRFAFYANVTYLRYLQVKEIDLITSLNEHNVKCFFLFGQRDKMYPQHLADEMISKLNFAHKTTLDEDHDMVNKNLPDKIYKLMYDN
ncbi:alpha/beta fold hydrolase [Pedobacter boryungensis]|uniref:Alpha/beta hydrolase n=1 Tax=Pedobacter boryungensis TaxID=869962 RepID=A0ABX2DF21_9SPHI|nr:alpha/beta hydrolase [Pedobacter boryungensis]NQX32063.1 alpha/beta hydrolase [Pedobacter boryungensis]